MIRIFFRWLAIFLIISILITGAFLGGHYYGRTLLGSSNTITNLAKLDTNTFFISQNAAAEGIITSINGNIVTVQSTKGLTADFQLSKNIIINKPNPKGGMATPSSDLKSVELNRKVSLVLTLVDGVYQVYSLQYNEP